MKTAVVLGGYGLIGSACLRALRTAGFRTVGIGRTIEAARRRDHETVWVARDIPRTAISDWRALLDGADVVVNAAGALQDGLRDDLVAIHETAVANLVAALRGTETRLVQISAAGVSDAAPTEFFRSKARGDRVVMEAGLNWVILRPTLVIGPEAYGGTALLRAAAAFPLVFPRVLPESRVQTVAVEDVARAVVTAAGGRIARGTVADLTETETRSLAEVTDRLRDWLGLVPWRASVSVPRPVLGLLARAADALGWFGWRSPLRTTAIRTLEAGVQGDPAAWITAGGAPCRPLEEILAAMPATAQDRWFARLFLLLPLLVGTLSVFWAASGVIGLLRRDVAQAVLTDRGVAPALAEIAVVAGSLVDLGLGLAILVRSWARQACLLMAAAAGAYLVGGTLLAADLWADPLGPLLKVLPAILLSLVTAAILEER